MGLRVLNFLWRFGLYRYRISYLQVGQYGVKPIRIDQCLQIKDYEVVGPVWFKVGGLDGGQGPQEVLILDKVLCNQGAQGEIYQVSQFFFGAVTKGGWRLEESGDVVEAQDV